MSKRKIDNLKDIIGNQMLAADVESSVEIALGSSQVHLFGSTVKTVMQNALKTAIRDIEEHPKGKLFQRFIEHGPHDSDHPPEPTSDGETTLSDPECGTCIEFIHSHMINRFKGELAELLAVRPCAMLLQQLQANGRLPENIQLYWGDLVQERRKVKEGWGAFMKGADGLAVRHGNANDAGLLELLGVIEVKSMYRSQKQLDAQIEKHIARLNGGVRLGTTEWIPENFKKQINTRISVLPSNWKLSREFHFERTETGSTMVFLERSGSTVPTKREEVSTNRWKITLSWSQEALEEAAYEMTFWYMAQVGHHVFSKTDMPRSWDDMTTDEAGRNSIKMMLYYAMLRPLRKRHDQLATKLYNIYCFGYPLGVDSREMLWPEDLH